MLCCDEATIESSLNGVLGSSTMRSAPAGWTPLTTWADGSASEDMLDRDEQCNQFSGNRKRRFDLGPRVLVGNENRETAAKCVRDRLQAAAGGCRWLVLVGAAQSHWNTSLRLSFVSAVGKSKRGSAAGDGQGGKSKVDKARMKLSAAAERQEREGCDTAVLAEYASVEVETPQPAVNVPGRLPRE